MATTPRQIVGKLVWTVLFGICAVAYAQIAQAEDPFGAVGDDPFAAAEDPAARLPAEMAADDVSREDDEQAKESKALTDAAGPDAESKARGVPIRGSIAA